MTGASFEAGINGDYLHFAERSDPEPPRTVAPSLKNREPPTLPSRPDGLFGRPPRRALSHPLSQTGSRRRELLAYGTSAPIRRITSFSAKFTDAPLAEGKFETYLHERENAKKPRAVRLSRPRL